MNDETKGSSLLGNATMLKVNRETQIVGIWMDCETTIEVDYLLGRRVAQVVVSVWRLKVMRDNRKQSLLLYLFIQAEKPPKAGKLSAGAYHLESYILSVGGHSCPGGWHLVYGYLHKCNMAWLVGRFQSKP